MVLFTFLRKIDRFGHPIGLKYKGVSNTYNTVVGGCLTLLFFGWLVVIITYRARQLMGMDNLFYASQKIEETEKQSEIGSVMAADVMVDPEQERAALSLNDMKILPYILIYDAITDKLANISNFNDDGSPYLNFERFGDLNFISGANDEKNQQKIGIRECTIDDFAKINATSIFESESRNGAVGGNMLCPAGDLSKLSVQNSQGRDLKWFNLEFKTCGQRPGCIQGMDAILEYNKYFRQFYIVVKYVSQSVDLSTSKTKEINEKGIKSIKPTELTSKELLNYQL